MEIHFTAEDPLGRKIICTEDRWFDHILPSRNWEDGVGWEDNVIIAIKNPFIICNDNQYPNRECFYYSPSENTHYMKVVVEIEENSGRIVTAIETDQMKRGETVIWPV